MRGVKFGNYHSFNDWGLYLASYPVVSVPSPQTTMVSIPGRDGALDLSQALDGTVHYDDRTLTFQFLCIAQRREWPTVYSRIQTALHGQLMDIILDDDPEYLYTGRVAVKSPNYQKRDFVIGVEATVKPFKVSVRDTNKPWLWDPFNFETGIIREYGHLTVNGSLDVMVYGYPLSDAPSVTVHTGSDMSVRIGGKSYQLRANKTNLLDYKPTSGAVVWTFIGTGEVSISIREKCL